MIVYSTVKVKVCYTVLPAGVISLDAQFSNTLNNHWLKEPCFRPWHVIKDIQTCRKFYILQVAVPRKCRTEILVNAHDSRFGGDHSGVAKTLSKVKMRY